VLRNRGLAFKLILLTVAASGFIFLSVFGYNYVFSKKLIEKHVEESARNLVMATVNNIEISLRSLQKVPQNAVCFVQDRDLEPKEITRLLHELLKANPDIYGSTIAIEPHVYKKNMGRFAPYLYRLEEGLAFTDLSTGKGDYALNDWYQIPKELERPDWSEPYFEGANDTLMSTFSVPLFKEHDGKRRFAGVITADISLEKLQDIVASLRILNTGYAFVISQNGMVVTHPKKEWIMNETIFGLAEQEGDEQLRALGKRMLKRESGFVQMRAGVFGKESWMYYAPIPSNGWSLAVLFPRDELMADVRRFGIIVAVLIAVGLLSLSFTIVLIARSITKPLSRMADATESIAAGDLDVELPVTQSGDEVGMLTRAFDKMRLSLKEHIRVLTETTAAKQRIESELNIAHDIQMSILPKIFPPFPDRHDIDIYATIEPAKEVGGDFYDFFFIDDTHICVVIADVSGKGVPASLFMAVTKTLIKAKTTAKSIPGEVLTRVNAELSEGNDTNMFVTVFLSILDLATGDFSYANGGHNPPLLIQQEGGVTFIEGSGEPIVGVLEGINYRTKTLRLKNGDRVCMYTDGVTEAANEHDELFGEKRMVAFITVFKNHTLEDEIRGLKEEVSRFAANVPQADDITILGLQFNGRDQLPPENGAARDSEGTG
jgi:sigma-B regulation protein RsbU (phosphoserine phosphatase)